MLRALHDLPRRSTLGLAYHRRPDRSRPLDARPLPAPAPLPAHTYAPLPLRRRLRKGRRRDRRLARARRRWGTRRRGARRKQGVARREGGGRREWGRRGRRRRRTADDVLRTHAHAHPPIVPPRAPSCAHDVCARIPGRSPSLPPTPRRAGTRSVARILRRPSCRRGEPPLAPISSAGSAVSPTRYPLRAPRGCRFRDGYPPLVAVAGMGVSAP